MSANVGQYEAVTFVWQCMDLFESLAPPEAKALIGRVRGCIQNPDDMRGLSMELLVATNVIRSGGSVAFPKDGTYDWLATIQGSQLEIECKSLSRDSGQAIHQRPAHQVAHLVKRETNGFIRSLSVGLFIRLRVPARLPSAHSDQLVLAQLVRRALLSANNANDPRGEVSILEFQLAELPVDPQPGEVTIRNFVRARLGPSVAEESWNLVYYDPGRYTVMLCITSEQTNRVVEAALDIAKDAAERQLTGSRPGALFLKFESLTATQLEDIGREEGVPSKLRTEAHQFLASGRNHVASITFLADGEIIQRETGAYSRTGTTYTFQNSQLTFAAPLLPSVLYPDA